MRTLLHIYAVIGSVHHFVQPFVRLLLLNKHATCTIVFNCLSNQFCIFVRE